MSDEKTAIEEVPFGRLDALGPALRALREQLREQPGALGALLRARPVETLMAPASGSG